MITLMLYNNEYLYVLCNKFYSAINHNIIQYNVYSRIGITVKVNKCFRKKQTFINNIIMYDILY